MLISRFIQTFCFFTLFFAIFYSSLGHSNTAPTESSSTAIFGASPIYSPGIQPTMVVDRFGMIDSTLTQQELDLIEKAITDWHAEGIEYGVYNSALDIETDLRYTLSAGAAVDLDGTDKTGTTDVNGETKTFYHMSPTRTAFSTYLIDSAKLAIDLGADYFFMDVASVDFFLYSFDDDVVTKYQAASGTDIRDYLKNTLGYADTAALQAAYDADNTLGADATWAAWVEYDAVIERDFFGAYTAALRDYATSLGQTVSISANRYIDDNDNWITADLFDHTIAETFLDTLGYPENNLDFFYKLSVAFGKRFWSWNFPNNTSTLNGGDNQPSNQLDRMFIAQTAANGGLSQVGGAGWVNFSKGIYPQVTIPDYQLIQSHPELFDHDEDSEIAVLYAEVSIKYDEGNLGAAFRGMSHLLASSHRSWDILFASDPNRPDSTELLTLAKLQTYKAVVLASTQYITDAQITLLESYLNDGGVVIGTGSNIARWDEDGVDQSGSRTFDDLFGSDATDTATYAGTVISINANLGQQFYNNPTDSALRTSLVTDFNAPVTPIVTSEIVTDLPSLTQISRYEDTADGSNIFHLVNTDYDSGTGNITQVVAGKTMTVPVPSNYAGTLVASIITPEATTPVVLTLTTVGSERQWTLPAIDTWAIIKFGSSAVAATVIDNKPKSQAHLIDSETTANDDGTATGGFRPDLVDENGDFVYSYWYWFNGDFSIPYLASDDSNVSSVELFYRYSADNATWSNWAASASSSDNTDIAIDTFTFTPNDGDGHYQFYFKATDDNSQVENSAEGDETGYGSDSTVPEPPPTFDENNGISNGIWQVAENNPEFTWAAPADVLSGIETGWLTLHRVATGETPANCTVNNQATINSWNLSSGVGCDGSATTSNLSDGEYRIDFRSRDNSDNVTETIETVFSLRIGTSSVDAPTNLTLEVGDSEATVHWTAPADLTGFDEVRIYPQNTAYSTTILESKVSVSITDSATDTQATLTGLTNGTEYQIAIEAYNRTTNLPGDLVTMACTFTPGISATTDCAAPASYSVTVTESDSSSDVTEGGATDTYTLVLGAQPANDVTISLSTDAELTTDVPSVVFTNGDWNVAQTVTITAVDDSNIEGEHISSITHSVTSSDANFNAISTASVDVNISDNDSVIAPAITVTESDSSTDVAEGGTSDSYDIVLTAQPTDNVTVNIITDNQINPDVASVVFTNANWDTVQPITISAVDDSDVENAHNSIITHNVSTSDTDYQGVSVASVTVNITDNDNASSASIILTESDASTDVTEGGATDSYTFVLGSQPTDDVTINVSSDTQSSTDVSVLTFTNVNWNTTQTITVTAVDDADIEGSHNSTISHSVTSNDVNYSGFAVDSVQISITDNDSAPPQASIVLSESGASTSVTEGGATDSYTFVLGSQPSSDVTINISSDSESSSDVSMVIFTSTNWDTLQTVVVSAVDDADVEGNHSSTITHTITSNDAGYANLSINDVSVSIIDNDSAPVAASITLLESGNSTTVTEGGTSDTYTIVLGTEPSADVIINISLNAQVSADVTDLTFTAANWDVAQTVTVSAVDDSAVENSHTGSLSHTVTSNDNGYDGFVIDDVSVTIADNDTSSTGGGSGGASTEESSGGGGLPFAYLVSLLLLVGFGNMRRR